VDRIHQKTSTALPQLLALQLRPRLNQRRPQHTNRTRPRRRAGQGIRVMGAQAAGSGLRCPPRRSKDDSSSRNRLLSNHRRKWRALHLNRRRRLAKGHKVASSSSSIPNLSKHAQSLARCLQMQADYLHSNKQQQLRLRIEPLHRTARHSAAEQARVCFQGDMATIRMSRRRTRLLHAWTAWLRDGRHQRRCTASRRTFWRLK
jgi:hypothetical protein